MFQSYQLTHHAEWRCEQRGIQAQILGTVIEEGQKVTQANGRIRHRKSEGVRGLHHVKQALVVITDASSKLVITSWREKKRVGARRLEKELRIPLSQNHLFGGFSLEDWEVIQIQG